MPDCPVIAEIPGFYRVIRLVPLRRTPGVVFDNVPTGCLPRIDAIDRVLHERAALSPGPVGDCERPWYMHPCQDDNLVVLAGIRLVDLFHPDHGIVHFRVTPDRVEREGMAVSGEPAMLTWPRRVFHRIESGPAGSASLNFAVHHGGFDIKSNFNIYALDERSGQARVIREGWLDQP